MTTVSDWEFWVTAALAAATLAVTCVAVLVGVVAIVGYQASRRLIRRHTERHARIGIDNYLGSQAFQAQLRNLVREIVGDNVRNIIISAPDQPFPTSRQQKEET